MKNVFKISLKSRTNLVALVTIALGVLALAFPGLPIQAAPETLITTGLGMIYIREAIQ